MASNRIIGSGTPNIHNKIPRPMIELPIKDLDEKRPKRVGSWARQHPGSIGNPYRPCVSRGLRLLAQFIVDISGGNCAFCGGDDDLIQSSDDIAGSVKPRHRGLLVCINDQRAMLIATGI
jgi:hypothetical protein